jgi:hypothetical protein
VVANRLSSMSWWMRFERLESRVGGKLLRRELGKRTVRAFDSTALAAKWALNDIPI